MIWSLTDDYTLSLLLEYEEEASTDNGGDEPWLDALAARALASWSRLPASTRGACPIAADRITALIGRCDRRVASLGPRARLAVVQALNLDGLIDAAAEVVAELLPEEDEEPDGRDDAAEGGIQESALDVLERAEIIASVAEGLGGDDVATRQVDEVLAQLTGMIVNAPACWARVQRDVVEQIELLHLPDAPRFAPWYEAAKATGHAVALDLMVDRDLARRGAEGDGVAAPSPVAEVIDLTGRAARLQEAYARRRPGLAAALDDDGERELLHQGDGWQLVVVHRGIRLELVLSWGLEPPRFELRGSHDELLDPDSADDFSATWRQPPTGARSTLVVDKVVIHCR